MADKITDHVAAAIARQTQQFKGKVNVEKLITILIEPVQRFEETAFQVLTERGIDDAVGVQLDVIGVIVGEDRQGKIDADYRRFLRATIRANKSSGGIEDLITIAVLILNDETASIIMEPGYPAGLIMRIEDITVDADTADALISKLRVARSGGVKFNLIFSPATNPEMFFTAIAAFLDGSTGIGVTTLPVVSTTGFTATGSLVLDEGIPADEETVTYTGITATSFTGVSATVNAHDDRAAVVLVGSPGLGFSDSAAPTTGGQLAGALE